MSFVDDVKANVAGGEAAHIVMLADPPALRDPLGHLDVAAAGIATIIRATGYRQDFDWLKVNGCDAKGAPIHQHGVSKEPGGACVARPAAE